MAFLQILFWLLLFIIFYCYAGYAIVVWIGQRFREKRSTFPAQTEWPPVTIVIASYNEASVLREKIENTLALDYPEEKLQVVVVADGSTDNTASVMEAFPTVKLLHRADRSGKAAAINHAMEYVTTGIVVFSDANTVLNALAIRNMVSHFANPQAGGVAGEKKVLRQPGVGSAEGLYWHYESAMKRLDASWYSVVGAAGELFAMRTELFERIPPDTILDDFVLSLHICTAGYIIAYEPGAFATEKPSASLQSETVRKVRIAAGAFQVLRRLSFKSLAAYPKFLFSFISRRWLRWQVCPFALPIVFLLNVYLANASHGIYGYLLLVQLIFYILAGIGWLAMQQRRTFLLTTLPFYFLFMNYCMIAGWLQWRRKKATVLWPKAPR